MRLLSHAERQTRYDGHQSARVIWDTPAIRAFLDRPDVTVLRFRSGWFHVYLGDAGFVGDTMLDAVEQAMKYELRRATP